MDEILLVVVAGTVATTFILALSVGVGHIIRVAKTQAAPSQRSERDGKIILAISEALGKLLELNLAMWKREIPKPDKPAAPVEQPFDPPETQYVEQESPVEIPAGPAEKPAPTPEPKPKARPAAESPGPSGKEKLYVWMKPYKPGAPTEKAGIAMVHRASCGHTRRKGMKSRQFGGYAPTLDEAKNRAARAGAKRVKQHICLNSDGTPRQTQRSSAARRGEIKNLTGFAYSTFKANQEVSSWGRANAEVKIHRASCGFANLQKSSGLWNRFDTLDKAEMHLIDVWKLPFVYYCARCKPAGNIQSKTAATIRNEEAERVKTR